MHLTARTPLRAAALSAATSLAAARLAASAPQLADKSNGGASGVHQCRSAGKDTRCRWTAMQFACYKFELQICL